MVMVAHLGSFGGASINIYKQDIFIRVGAPASSGRCEGIMRGRESARLEKIQARPVVRCF